MQTQQLTHRFETEAALLEFAGEFAKKLFFLLPKSCYTLYLEGALGAGKTTFVRGFLRGLGYTEAVKSPSFSLVESYEIAKKTIYHFDLYRISDPETLAFKGLNDYFTDHALCFIEWPSLGRSYLPSADMTISIEGEGSHRFLSIQGLLKPALFFPEVIG